MSGGGAMRRDRSEIPGATIIFWLPLLVFLAVYAAVILIWG